MTEYAPTDLWPCRWSCDISTTSPIVTGSAVQFASLLMWGLTGRQFGFTTVKLRPCRDVPRETPYPDGWLSWPGTQTPPLGATVSTGAWWFPVGCGSCSDGCACDSLNVIKLPAPVHDVVEVRVDGSPLVTGAYRLDNHRFVRRLDATWPANQNLNLPDTSVGTWSITAHYGVEVPGGADLAIGELACEYIKAANGENCRLPRGVTQLARQGVTISMPDMAEMLDKGKTGFAMVDLVIQTWNPSHLRQRSRVYGVDRPTFTQTG